MIPLALIQNSNDEILIPTTLTGVNLKALYEATRPPASSGQSVTFTVVPGALVGGITTGVWAAGVSLRLNVNTGTGANEGVIGPGGNGTGPSTGGAGGDGLIAQSPITVDNTFGRIAGGGGGGAGSDQWPGTTTPATTYAAGGGGGAGVPPGSGGTAASATNSSNGQSGTTNSGGAAGSFGSDPNQPGNAHAGWGGGLGLPGGNAADSSEVGSTDNVGGAAGRAVVGNSFITWIGTGSRIGAVV